MKKIPALKNCFLLLLLFSFLTSVYTSRAQEPDTTKILNEMSGIWAMHFRNMDSALMVSRKCYNEARNSSNRLLFLRSMHMLGVIEQESGDYQASVRYLDSAINLAGELRDTMRLGALYNSLGISYNKLDKTKLGMKCILQAARIKEKNGDLAGSAVTYLNIAGSYANQRDTANALKYASDAMDLCYKNKVELLYTEVNTVVGQIYELMGDTAKARQLLLKALANSKKENTPMKSITIYVSLVDMAALRYDTATCRRLILDLDKTMKATNNNMNLPDLYIAWAQYYLLKKNYALCEKNARLALGLADAEHVYAREEKIYPILVKALKEQGKTAEALQFYEAYTALKDSMITINNLQAVRRLEAEFDSEKKETEIEMLSTEKTLKEEELKRKNNFILAGIIALIIITGFSFALLRLYKRNQRNFSLLQLRSTEIEIKNSIITEKNNDITDSINYARRIQDAVLPDFKNRSAFFRESFILYIPKDILSGDFYWFTEKNGKKIIAATDCTGHGVPGALLSIAGSTFLNEIINQRGITEPATILNELSAQLMNSLKQTGAEGENKDGMDIALLCIDEKSQSVEFAGANNSAWIVCQKDGKAAYEEIKGDRQPIGYSTGQHKPFTNHRQAYNKGDLFYLFTDGYSDQFGGAQNKKFKRKNLLKLLAENSTLGMNEQEQLLRQKTEQWKGSQVQTDDILVIGLRL